jgi:hypothetical protein
LLDPDTFASIAAEFKAAGGNIRSMLRLGDLGLGSFLDHIKPQDMQVFASIFHTDTDKDADTDTDTEAEQGGQTQSQIVSSTGPQKEHKSLKQQNPDALSSSSVAKALGKFLADKREIEAKEEEVRQLASTPELSKPDLIQPELIKRDLVKSAAAAASATATHAHGQDINPDINNIKAPPARAVPL